MSYQEITKIEKNINELLKLYDKSVLDKDHEKSRKYLILIENELDLLDKNEVNVKTTLH